MTPEPAGIDDPTRLLGRLERFGMKLGLRRMRILLSALSDPHRGLPAVLVAGTNGKGSTAALLASMLEAAGYRSALYTSPHLERPEERLRLGRANVASAVLTRALERTIAACERALGGPPTYFEAMTAAAFLVLAETPVDLAVLEVGLGGRLDATNVAEPVLAVITELAIEHRQQLGDTLGAIAREKAGILRRGRPALAATREPEARDALVAEAARRGARLRFLDDEVAIGLPAGASPGRRHRFLVATPRRTHSLELPLAGAHQRRNAALAVRAAELLAVRGFDRLDPAAIRRGVSDVRWPGRLESFRVGRGEVLLDAAHNPAAVSALVAELDARRTSFDLLFGVLDDKDVGGMLPPLAARASHVTLTRPESARARPPESLRPLLAPGVPWRVVHATTEALASALAREPRLLVVTGSIYLVGRVRAIVAAGR